MAVLCLLPSARAATVTGNLLLATGNPAVTNVVFTPKSTPLAQGPSIITSWPTNVLASTNGAFSVYLLAGDYTVVIGKLARDSFLISVPSDTNTYNLADLVQTSLTYTNPTLPNLVSLPAGRSLYVDQQFGSDATGQRTNRSKPFLTITGAKNAALPGDLIWVGPGAYWENNLLKANVHYWFADGAYVSWTNTAASASGIFDDRALLSGTTNIIAGHGRFSYALSVANGNCAGLIAITNAKTDLSFTCVSLVVSNGFTPIQAAVSVRDCARVVVNCDSISDLLYGLTILDPDSNDISSICSGVYWARGEMYVHAKLIRVNANCVWADEPAGAPSTSIYVDVDLMQAFGQSAVYMTGIQDNYKVWINSLELYGGQGAIAPYTGGKLYVTAQKISAGPGNGAILMSGASPKCWVTAQKISSPTSWVLAALNWGGQLHLNCAHYEDLGGLAAGFDFSAISSGTAFIMGGEGKVLNGKGLHHRGSTIHLIDLALDTSTTDSTNNPAIFALTNNLTLRNVRLLAPPSAYAINATNSRNIALAGSLSANRPSSANIIFDATNSTYLNNPLLAGSGHLGTEGAYGLLAVDKNSSISISAGAQLLIVGDDPTTRSEILLHGTNAYIRFDEDAAVTDITSAKIWKFNRVTITSNNVARLGDLWGAWTKEVFTFGVASASWTSSQSFIPVSGYQTLSLGGTNFAVPAFTNGYCSNLIVRSLVQMIPTTNLTVALWTNSGIGAPITTGLSVVLDGAAVNWTNSGTLAWNCPVISSNNMVIAVKSSAAQNPQGLGGSFEWWHQLP